MAHRNLLTPRAARPDDLHQQVSSTRKGQDLSKATLATRADVSLRTVQRLEQGKAVSADKILRIEQALGLGRGTLVPGWDTRATVLSDAIGPRVRELRRSHGHTLRELASMLRTSVSTLSRIENGLLGDVDRWPLQVPQELAFLYFRTRQHFDDWVEGHAATPRPLRS